MPAQGFRCDSHIRLGYRINRVIKTRVAPWLCLGPKTELCEMIPFSLHEFSLMKN